MFFICLCFILFLLFPCKSVWENFSSCIIIAFCSEVAVQTLKLTFITYFFMTTLILAIINPIIFGCLYSFFFPCARVWENTCAWVFAFHILTAWYPIIREHLNKEWEEKWNECNAFLYQSKPVIEPRIKKCKLRIKRWDCAKWTQAWSHSSYSLFSLWRGNPKTRAPVQVV